MIDIDSCRHMNLCKKKVRLKGVMILNRQEIKSETTMVGEVNKEKVDGAIQTCLLIKF